MANEDNVDMLFSINFLQGLLINIRLLFLLNSIGVTSRSLCGSP
jgi:hypothetical protein